MRLPKALEAVLGELDPRLEGVIEPTPEGKWGDMGFPVFLLGGNPVEKAKELEEGLKEKADGLGLEEVKAVGPYVNFSLSKVGWEEVLGGLEEGGVSEVKKGGRIVVDYGGENVAKPLSVGHLRSNIIGQAFCNCARELGYEVVADNHLGDWGTQFGKLAVAIKKWGDWAVIKKDPINELVKLYQRFHVEAEKDESLEEEARVAFKGLSEGEEERMKEWEKICKWTKDGLAEVHGRLGVRFDVVLGESFYRGERMREVVEECKRAGVVMENEDGSLAVVPPEEEKLPSFLIQKSDGATLYHTSDLAAVKYRLEKWSPERVIYFVAEPQGLHFRQLFWLVNKLGWGRGVSFEHASFGLVRLPEGKMSTRGGNVIRLEELLDEAKRRAYEILEEKQPEVPKSEWDDLAEKVGVGAVVYGDLFKDRSKGVIFDWDQVLNFDGQTAPYIQYTYARAMAILRKAERGGKINFAVGMNEAEKSLVIKIGEFEKNLIRVVEEAKPSYLAQWVYDLAVEFNKFYKNCPVIKAEEKKMGFRFLLVKLTKNYIKRGLGLLGIEVPEKM